MCQPDLIVAVMNRRPGWPAEGAVNRASIETTLLASAGAESNRLPPAGPEGLNWAAAGQAAARTADVRTAIVSRCDAYFIGGF